MKKAIRMGDLRVLAGIVAAVAWRLSPAFGATTVFSETWEPAAVQTFTPPTPVDITGDNLWHIVPAMNTVDITQHPVLGSKAFGQLAASAAGAATDVHYSTAFAPITAGNVSSITLKAKFAFNNTVTVTRNYVMVTLSNDARDAFIRIVAGARTSNPPFICWIQRAATLTNQFNVGAAGDQNTTSVWDLTAKFTPVDASTTACEYTFLKDGAPYQSGTNNLTQALDPATVLTKCAVEVQDRAPTSVDDIQISVETAASVGDWRDY